MSRAPPTRNTGSSGTSGRPQAGSLRPATSTSNMRSAASPSSPSKPRVHSQLKSPARPARGRAAGDSTSSPSKGAVDEKKKPAGASSISLREAIAQKRAEAKKLQKAAQDAERGLDDMTNMQDAVPSFDKPADEPIEVGRWPLLEAIERARRSGNINLSTRSLTCIPSALFELHLGITPAPLQSAAEERSSSSTSHQSSSYYDTHDLEVLKAWSNDIIEIQPEISMFGSLKILDLHSNKIRSLPDSFADLTALKVLDLSHNALASLPVNIFALPNLINFNISHNELTSLPFNAPFEGGTQPSARPAARSTSSSVGGGGGGLAADSFFEPSIFRASTPLPALLTLDASHNRITAHTIDAENAPKSIRSLNLSSNPLNTSGSSGDAHWNIDDDFDDPSYTAKKSLATSASALLLNRLGALRALQELHFAHAEIDDGAFAFSPPSSSSSGELNTGAMPPSSAFFPALRLLDLEETKVTEPAVRTAFRPFGREINTKNLTPDRISALTASGGGHVGVGGSRDAVSPGVRGAEGGSDDSNNNSIIHTIIGKKIVREAWEIEAEQRRRGGGRARQTMPSSSSSSRVADENDNAQDEWGISFGPSPPSSTPRQKQQPAAAPTPTAAATTTTARRPTAAVVEKEPWEIEAEQGLLTEGGRRRARAAAAAKEKEEEEERQKKAKGQQQEADVELTTGTSAGGGSRTSPTATSVATSASASSSLVSSQYYSNNTRTLSLPASVPVRGVQGHHRAFSYAASPSSSSSFPAAGAGDLSVPVPTLPLSMIAVQPFAATLRVLELCNRRRDVSFDLPQTLPNGLEQVTLPYLEGLSLEGCSLGDTVPVSRTHIHHHDTVSSSSSNNGASPSHSGGMITTELRSCFTTADGIITGGRTNEALLPLLASLFPSLRSLDLSYNLITSASLTAPILRGLILSSPKNEDEDENGNHNASNNRSSSPIGEWDGVSDNNNNSSNNNKNSDNDPIRRPGLRHLRLRGNRIENLDELETLALDLFRGNRREPTWRLEELDMRENSVGKLPPGLGMMPLDVFLVEGNSFRVPQRKVWEREGTKGLLSWLRGRMD